MVRSRPTTDNFLPLTRRTSYHKPRAIRYVPRQISVPPQDNRGLLISDFLPPTLQSTRPKQQHRKWSAYALPIIALVLTSGLIGFELTNSQTKQTNSLQFAVTENPDIFSKQPSTSIGLPERLKIPKINVDAPFDHVGLTPLGEVDVPKDPANVGWYNHGPRPGEQGNAVIDGHFGWRDGLPAVFDDVHKLQKGDKLYIEDEKGLTVTFVVRELQTFGQTESVPNVFIPNDKKAHLNLITCHGVWNNKQRSYPDRLVVFADKEI